jgi:hypothetical protein
MDGRTDDRAGGGDGPITSHSACFQATFEVSRCFVRCIQIFCWLVLSASVCLVYFVFACQFVCLFVCLFGFVLVLSAVL